MWLTTSKIGLFLVMICAAPMSKAALRDSSLESWLVTESEIAKTALWANLSPPAALPGCVIASPSKANPDYFFHWTRDAALVMNALIKTSDQDSLKFENEFRRYLIFSQHSQNVSTPAGLGEPRFNVDGSVYLGLWSRPQNDGPALRAHTLLAYLTATEKGIYSLQPGQLDSMREILSKDLDYVVANAFLPDFDLWEELKGRHYDTRLKQAWALDQGAKRFLQWNDSVRAQLYSQKASAIYETLGDHWSEKRQVLLANLDRVEGAPQKQAMIDTAVVLSVLQTDRMTGSHSVSDDRIMKTAYEIEAIFARAYELNKDKNRAPAIGRYEEDVYFGGNPWYLTTAAFAEYHYRLATVIKQSENFQITSLSLPLIRSMPGLSNWKEGVVTLEERSRLAEALFARGDAFLETLREFTPADGHMAEQFHRALGTPVSARDLTWSYASFLTALNARQAAALPNGSSRAESAEKRDLKPFLRSKL